MRRQLRTLLAGKLGTRRGQAPQLQDIAGAKH